MFEPHYGSGQPEGSASEWRDIIAAMKESRSKSFCRVAVRFSDGVASFTSPRNSMASEYDMGPDEQPSFIKQAEQVLDESKMMMSDSAGI